MADQILLSNKRSLLSSLGKKYNGLYYSEENSTVELCETTFCWQNILSLPSVNFGSSSTISIPIDQFIQECVLHLRLPALQANESVCRGWGYASLASISYLIGASNSTQVVIQEDSIWQTVAAQCTTDEKRSELFRLGGDEHLGLEVVPAGEAPEYVDAFIVIPLPFSTACDKLPMDSTLLSQNISVTFNFKNTSAIYGGSAVHPTSFVVAEVMLRQGKLSNQAASIRQEMIAHPELCYSYPFVLTSRFLSAPFQGSRYTDSRQGCKIQLNSFNNADLLGIAFYVVRDDYKSPAANSTPNPFVLDELTDILVSFNGSTLFNLPGKSYKTTNCLIGEQQASYYQNSLVLPGAAPPFTSVPKDCYPVFLDFARVRSACLGQEMQNTWRIGNQTILLEFSTQFGSNVSYKLYATYFYNAICEFQSGTSALYIG